MSRVCLHSLIASCACRLSTPCNVLLAFRLCLHSVIASCACRLSPMCKRLACTQTFPSQSHCKLCMQIVSPCHCGKVAKPVRCSQANFSCGKLCGKRLSCGHRCPHKCHPGNCPDCTLTATVSCHCGAEAQTLPCSQRDFHCDRVCGKVLSCGRHSCDKVCHGGACGGCPMEGPRLCPCGKVQVPAFV